MNMIYKMDNKYITIIKLQLQDKKIFPSVGLT